MKFEWIATVKCLPGSRRRLHDRLQPGNGGKTPCITRVDFGDFGISPVGAVCRGTHENDDARRVHHDVAAKLSSMLGTMMANIEVVVLDAPAEEEAAQTRREDFDLVERLVDTLTDDSALVVVYTSESTTCVPGLTSDVIGAGKVMERAQTFVRQALGNIPIANIGRATKDTIECIVESVKPGGELEFQRVTLNLEPTGFDVTNTRALTDWACKQLGITAADLDKPGETLEKLRDAFAVWYNEANNTAAVAVYRPSDLPKAG